MNDAFGVSNVPTRLLHSCLKSSLLHPARRFPPVDTCGSPSVPHLKELEQALRDHDAALSMGVDVALGIHTVTVFADGPQLFVRDPGRRGFHTISGLQDIGKLVDSVLYVAK